MRTSLLKHDEPLDESAYQEYRRKLEVSLDRAERTEKRVGWFAATCFVVALTLMFVGGSQILGAFDPTDDDATLLSVTLGGIYCVAAVGFWLGLASYFSRFRPQTRAAKDEIRDARLLEMERQIAALRSEIKQALKEK